VCNIKAAFNIYSVPKVADDHTYVNISDADDHTYVKILDEEQNNACNNTSALVYMPQRIQLTKETMDLDEVPSVLADDREVIDCKTLRTQLLSECQQLIALVSTCNDTAVLQSMLTHMSAALDMARASTQYQPKIKRRMRRTVSKKSRASKT